MKKLNERQVSSHGKERNTLPESGGGGSEGGREAAAALAAGAAEKVLERASGGHVPPSTVLGPPPSASLRAQGPLRSSCGTCVETPGRGELAPLRPPQLPRRALLDLSSLAPSLAAPKPAVTWACPWHPLPDPMQTHISHSSPSSPAGPEPPSCLPQPPSHAPCAGPDARLPPGAPGPAAQTTSRMAPAAQPQQSADRGPSPGSWPRDPSQDSDLTSSPLGPTARAGGPSPSLAGRSQGALAAPGLRGISPETSPKSCALRGVGGGSGSPRRPGHPLRCPARQADSKEGHEGTPSPARWGHTAGPTSSGADLSPGGH